MISKDRKKKPAHVSCDLSAALSPILANCGVFKQLLGLEVKTHPQESVF